MGFIARSEKVVTTMFNETIYGMPKRCLNRNCRTPFCRESHLGVIPHSETEVKTIMRCPKCRYTFEVQQAITMVYEYFQRLPADETIASRRTNPITEIEMADVRKRLDDPHALSKLFEGLRPGAAELGSLED